MKKIISGILAVCLTLCMSVPAFASTTKLTPAATFKSDTGSKVSLTVGKTYQFRVTSTNGVKPTFVVAGKSFVVKANGSKGNNYYFIVKAVGQAGNGAGVYIGGQKKPSTIITITAPVTKVDAGSKLTVAKGKTYQFKITSSVAPVVKVGNNSTFQIVSKTEKGTNYYFKVKATGNKGQATGLYVNGTRVTVCTVG